MFDPRSPCGRWIGAACIVVLRIALGCGGEPPAATEPRSNPTATCDDDYARYRAVLATASGACRTEADCVPWGGFDPYNVCGGSTDAATGRTLDQIAAEAHAAGCPVPGYSCPPIIVRCIDGHCGRVE